jgi:hypothetical protein
VSVLNDDGERVMDEYRGSLTVFVCNALAKNCAPLAPIMLPSKFNVVSVCI